MSMAAGILGGAAAYAAESLLQVDEVSVEKNPDGSVTVVLLTTGLHPSLARVKVLLWSLLGLPVQSPDEVVIEELQSGPVLKRYRVTVRLRPAWERLRRGEGLGVLPVLTGENVRVL